MNKFKLKFILPAIAMLMVMAVVVPGTTEAGKKWSGIDPIFIVNGDLFNVWIEWPEGYGCSIDEPIDVKVTVPSDVSYVLLSESIGDVDNCGFPQVTETKAKFKKNAKGVSVDTKVHADEDFPVRVKVFYQGELIGTYEGESNKPIKGREFDLPGLHITDDGHNQKDDNGKDRGRRNNEDNRGRGNRNR